MLEEEGSLVGRALWWGRGDIAPSVLDALDVLPEVADARAAAVTLLRGGHADFEKVGEPYPPCVHRPPARGLARRRGGGPRSHVAV